MFTDLSHSDLATLITNLRTALLNLAMGQATAEIRYTDGGESFHPSDPKKTEELLNKAIAERDKRASGCSSLGALFPVGI